MEPVSTLLTVAVGAGLAFPAIADETESAGLGGSREADGADGRRADARDSDLGRLLSGVRIFGTAGVQDLPGTGTGFRREGLPGAAAERYSVELPDKVDTYGAGVALTLDGYSLFFSYAEGKESRDFSIPALNGVTSGVDFGGPSPFGSSGLETSFGSQGGISLDFKTWQLGGEVPLKGKPGDRLFLAAHGGYTHMRRQIVSDVEAIFNLPALAAAESNLLPEFGFRQDRDQRLGDDLFELGARAELRGRNGALQPWVSGLVAAYYLHSSLHSVENDRQTISFSVVPDFLVEIDDKLSKVGVRAGLAAGVDLAVSPGATIGVAGSADYRSTMSGVFNPLPADRTGDPSLTTGIYTGDMWSLLGSVNIFVGF